MAPRYFGHNESTSEEFGIEKYWQSPLESLEDAVRPLLSMFPNIYNLVTTAKANCLKSPHGLTNDESAAIYLYTMEMNSKSLYKILNSVLRHHDLVRALPWFSYLKLLGTALKKLPSYSGPVWRIVNNDVAKDYERGTTIRWWAFTSCTKALSVLQTFQSNTDGKMTVMMIESRNGKDIAAYSYFKNEEEVLLMSGSTFISADSSLVLAGSRVVHLREVTTSKVAPATLSPSHSHTELSNHKKNKPMQIGSTLHQGRKTNCPHCGTSLIFSNSPSQGERSTCCVCKRLFQEVQCPYCYQANIWKNGTYHAGKKVTCASCNKIFQHLNCPHCHHAAFWTGKHRHKSGLRTLCQSCHRYYCAINCPDCNETFYYKDNQYKPGLPFQCFHCNNTFREINCPDCKEALFYKDAAYKAGLPFKCSYCQKTHQAINCPHCSELNIWRNHDLKPGLRITCHKCKKIYQHVNCPSCAVPCVWKYGDFIPGYRTTCHNCHVIFQNLNCPHCQASHVWTGGSYKERNRIHCQDCGNDYQHTVCPHCKQANYFTRGSLSLFDRVKCLSCGNTF